MTESTVQAITLGNRNFYTTSNSSEIILKCESKQELDKIIKHAFEDKDSPYTKNAIIDLFKKYLPYPEPKLNSISGKDKRNLIKVLTLYNAYLQESKQSTRYSIRNSRYDADIKPIRELIKILNGSSTGKKEKLKKLLSLTDKEKIMIILRIMWNLANTKNMDDDLDTWTTFMETIDTLDLKRTIRSLDNIGVEELSLPSFSKTKKATDVEALGTSMKELSSPETATKQLEDYITFLKSSGYIDTSYKTAPLNQLKRTLPRSLIRMKGGASTMLRLVSPIFDTIFSIYGPYIRDFMKEIKTIPVANLVSIIRLSYIMNILWKKPKDTAPPESNKVYTISNMPADVIAFVKEMTKQFKGYIEKETDSVKKKNILDAFDKMEHVPYTEHNAMPRIFLLTQNTDSTQKTKVPNNIYLLYLPSSSKVIEKEYSLKPTMIDFKKVVPTDDSKLDMVEPNSNTELIRIIIKEQIAINHILFSLILLRMVQLSYPEIALDDLQDFIIPSK